MRPKTKKTRGSDSLPGVHRCSGPNCNRMLRPGEGTTIDGVRTCYTPACVKAAQSRQQVFS